MDRFYTLLKSVQFEFHGICLICLNISTNKYFFNYNNPVFWKKMQYLCIFLKNIFNFLGHINELQGNPIWINRNTY